MHYNMYSLFDDPNTVSLKKPIMIRIPYNCKNSSYNEWSEYHITSKSCYKEKKRYYAIYYTTIIYVCTNIEH